jgi:hypothetical protein
LFQKQARRETVQWLNFSVNSVAQVSPGAMTASCKGMTQVDW